MLQILGLCEAPCAVSGEGDAAFDGRHRFTIDDAELRVRCRGRSRFRLASFVVGVGTGMGIGIGIGIGSWDVGDRLSASESAADSIESPWWTTFCRALDSLITHSMRTPSHSRHSRKLMCSQRSCREATAQRVDFTRVGEPQATESPRPMPRPRTCSPSWEGSPPC